MGDLAWLRSSGMEAAIAKAYEKGSVLFGICGGYQLLGKSLSDPYQVEGGGSMKGLGYLPVDTVFTREKTRTRVRGKFEKLPGALAELSGHELEGYEIHMGETKTRALAALTHLTDEKTGEKKPDGAVGERVYGTYVHGIFDAEGVADALAASMAKEKGVALDAAGGSMEQYRQTQFDLLADTLRRHLDLDAIYEVMNL
jgi:adenosylcobyric acid synthase